MVKRLLFIWLLGFVAFFAQAQDDCGGPPADVPPAESCPETCIYCDFAGYMGSTDGYQGNGLPPGGFCSMIQNDQWLGFIAGAASATFSIIPSNCQNGNGVQVALYESCNTAPLGCNGGCAGCGNQTTTIAVNMVVGTNYFLLIDGFSGDICDLTISVAPPSAVQAPPVGGISPIQGPAMVCPGATVNYLVPSVTGAGSYTWTSNNAGVTFNGEFSPAKFDAPEGRIVQVTFPTNVTGNVQICVNANNSCNNGPTICRTINVQPIPPTAFPKAVICNEDAPYTLPWGDEVSAVGDKLYKTTLTSYLGCDSVVQQQVFIKPPLTTNIGTKYICEGGSVVVCGNEIMDSGPIQEVCQSFQGCDSTVTGFVNVLAPVAEILGGGTLSCVTDSIQLNSAGSPNGSVKVWRRPPAVVGTGDKYTVTAPGTYVLTTTMNLGGVSCVKADTIVITGNTTPPVAGATANGFIGCGNGTTTVSGTSSVPNSTYQWGPPLNSSLQTAVVVASGTYTVTVTSGLNGCTATATVAVTGNTTPPTVAATGGTLTCAVTSIGIGATSSAPQSNYLWAGPMSFTSTLPAPNVTAPGTYTVTVTNTQNNCTATATATVLLNNAPPTAAAVVGGSITCPTPVQTIGTSTDAAGPTYQWGPPPFASNSPNPSVSAAGTYTVTVTATGGNGCTATASATVTGDTVPPDATALGGTVTCGTPGIALDGGSATAPVTYAWSGPNGYTATAPDPTATAPGVYTLTVTASNNCTATATAEVAGDFVAPTGVTAAGGTITCGSVSTAIGATSGSSPVTYQWDGPGNFADTTAIATAFNTGIYTVVVTSPNGCTATATAEVAQDANVPDASASGGVLNCVNKSVVLDGGSATPGVTLAWTGPNGFTSVAEDPLVALDGIYVLTVTNPANGCSKIAQANVQVDTITPGASALAGTLTCASPSLALAGSSPTPSVTWTWAGPDPAFPSTQQSPTASTAGFYTLTVSATGNGCTSTATAEVLVDKAVPVPSSTAGTLTCKVTSLLLEGASTLPSTFKWSGPGNFGSTLNAPTVTVPGDYTLEVTAANGCTGTVSVPVAQDIAAPGASAGGGTLSCAFPQIDLNSSSPTAGAAYAWGGPGGFSSQQQAPAVSVNGTYTVTVTDPGNGCTSTDEAEVALDNIPPVAFGSSPDVLTCAALSVVVQATAANASSPVTALAWTGPNGFASSVEDPSVTAPGVYLLTATSANGCSATATVEVKEDVAVPGATASSGTLTCFSPTINFDGGSLAAGAAFAWAGPNFSSSLEDPAADVPGVYTLTVTAPNGCTSTAETELLQDIAPPGATALSSNNLDCDDLTSALSGGPAADVTWRWTGPNGFDKTGPAQTVSEPGTYLLTTASTLNGCTSTASVEVTQDVAQPGATALGGTLDCVSGTVALTGGPSAPGLKYKWDGPSGYQSTLQSPVNASNPGTYTLTVTGLNGCTSTATATVAQNTSAPQVTLTSPAVLTCATDTVSITATITTPGATGVWSGPGGFSSASPTIQVDVPGTYTYTVVNPANGCKVTPSRTVAQNVAPPQNVTAAGGQIDCVTPTISITGGTSTANADYEWAGPNGYVSLFPSPNDVTLPGTYTLTVTNKANGCTASATAVVTLDPTVPEIAVTTEVITCKMPSVVLQATTNNPAGVTWNWAGPGITPATKTVEDPAVAVPGDYTVVVKAVSSGCTASFSVKVDEDKKAPGATAQGDTLTCLVSSIPVVGGSPTANVEYKWEGPGGFASDLPSPSAALVGTYTLTVTGLNGCTSTATAVVSPDKNAPVVAAEGGTVTCAVTSVTLNAESSLPVTWLWSGPGGFSSTQQSPVATLAGNYVVQATAANGCSVSTGVTVVANTALPDVDTSVPDELNCTTTQVGLEAAVAGAGPFTYAWGTANGSIVSGGTSPAPTVSQAGLYALTVTNTSNGCTSVAQVTVLTDPATPSGVAAAKRNVSCFGDTNGTISVDSVQGGTPPFLFSLDSKPFSAATSFASLPPGPHLLMVQDANGCEFEVTLDILEPEQLVVDLGRDTTIHLGDSIALDLNNIVNFPDRVDQLLVKPADIFSGGKLGPKHSFRYTATVVDSNGCKAADDRVVIVDKTRLVFIPNVLYPESANGNELLRISVGQDVEAVKSFQIYDRWGAAVYEKRNFLPQSPNNDGWDGRVKGDRATPAVFVYYAEILFKDGETEIFKGDITVYR